MKNEDCVFCKIAQKNLKSNILMESNNFIAFYDIYPKAEGHTLIVPKSHFVTLFDIPDKLGEELLSFTKKASSFLLDEKFGDGFNIVMNNLEPAGQVVKHAYFQIIPRKEGDGLKSTL